MLFPIIRKYNIYIHVHSSTVLMEDWVVLCMASVINKCSNPSYQTPGCTSLTRVLTFSVTCRCDTRQSVGAKYNLTNYIHSKHNYNITHMQSKYLQTVMHSYNNAVG